MFKIVVDKVNKKASDSHKQNTKTEFSGFSWPDKLKLPKPKKREQIFKLADNPVGAAAVSDKNTNFRRNFEGLENASFN